MAQANSIILTQRLNMFFHYQKLYINLIFNFFMEENFHASTHKHFHNKKLIWFSVIDCISLGILLLPVNLGEESPR